MTMPLMKPKRKNPVLRTRQMNLPPWARGRVALGMTAAAAEGRFELQVCRRCQAVHRSRSALMTRQPLPGGGRMNTPVSLTSSRVVSVSTSSANSCSWIGRVTRSIRPPLRKAGAIGVDADRN